MTKSGGPKVSSVFVWISLIYTVASNYNTMQYTADWLNVFA